MLRLQFQPPVYTSEKDGGWSWVRTCFVDVPAQFERIKIELSFELKWKYDAKHSEPCPDPMTCFKFKLVHLQKYDSLQLD